MKVLSLIFALFYLCSCSKENILKPEISRQINAYWVSEKLDINKVLLRKDTSKVNLWFNISQQRANELKGEGEHWIDFSGCPVSPIPELPSFKWEKMYWIIEYK